MMETRESLPHSTRDTAKVSGGSDTDTCIQKQRSFYPGHKLFGSWVLDYLFPFLLKLPSSTIHQTHEELTAS